MITVLGATGNTGSRVATSLLARGVPVRAVGRDADRLRAVVPGAEPRVGDARDEAFLRTAFDGADAAYVLMPLDLSAPDYAEQQAAVGSATVAALRAAGVPRVVALSSLGADLPGGPDLDATGFLGTLHDQEQRLRTLDAAVTLLRPGMFFESLLVGLDAMRADGVHADSIDPDLALPMVAARDVADVAVEELLRPATGVTVREVLGAADHTVVDVVTGIGRALGTPVHYVRIPDDELEKALLDAGLPADVARLQVAMNRAFDDGRVRPLAGRGPATTTSTTLAQWVTSAVVP